jgi:hypothetical protein
MNDWVRLLVKYKGMCSTCGKEIPSGQYVLWSKSSKAIKHIECNITSHTASTEKKQVDMNRQQSIAAKVDCFICGRPVVGHNDSGFVEADGYGRQAISQASICNECQEDKNAYQNYQHAFLERVHRVTKVRTWT